MLTPKMKLLADALMENCPDNDCRIYLNLYVLYKEYKDDLEGCLLGINTQHIIEREMRHLESDMKDLYLFNYAVNRYRRETMSHA